MKTPRNYTTDLIRIIAAFGVVAIHVHANTFAASIIGDFFSPLCVPFFFTISLVFFVAGLQENPTIKTTLSKIFVRLVIPYLCWTIIYSSLVTAKHILAHDSSPIAAWWRALLYGESAVQMYYLPHLAALQIITLGIYTLVSPAYTKKVYPSLLLICGIFFLWIGNYNTCFALTGPGAPLRYGFYIFCGFLLSFAVHKQKRNFWYILAGLSMITFTVASFFMHIPYFIMDYPITFLSGGLGLTLISIGAPSQRLPLWLVRLSNNSYGIYLSHILFLESFEFIVEKVSKEKIHYNFLTKFIFVIGVFFLSVLFTNFIRKIPILKQALLGEGNKDLNFSIRTKQKSKTLVTK